MDPASPARLYATLVGAILAVLGILGFFHDLSWLNFLYLGSGALGLALAGCASRYYALGAGLLYTALAIAGFSGAGGWLQLGLGLLGLAAAAGTARPSRGSKSTKYVRKEPRRKRRSEPRAKAAAEGP
jgi:hypothetical protein